MAVKATEEVEDKQDPVLQRIGNFGPWQVSCHPAPCLSDTKAVTNICHSLTSARPNWNLNLLLPTSENHLGSQSLFLLGHGPRHMFEHGRWHMPQHLPDMQVPKQVFARLMLGHLVRCGHWNSMRQLVLR